VGTPLNNARPHERLHGIDTQEIQAHGDEGHQDNDGIKKPSRRAGMEAVVLAEGLAHIIGHATDHDRDREEPNPHEAPVGHCRPAPPHGPVTGFVKYKPMLLL
jgi:hypothetical protein